MTRRSAMVFGVGLLVVACILIPLWLSSLSRQHQVDADRAACHRSGENYAHDVNMIRANMALIVAEEPASPSAQQISAVTAAMRSDRASIAEKDAKIDPVFASLLMTSADRRTVMSSGFSCDRVFPPTGIFP